MTEIYWQATIRKGIEQAACKVACAAGIDVPRYVRLIAEGKFPEALAVSREKVPFPATLGRVCLAPCEYVCRRAELNEPIAIRASKCFAADCDSKSLKQNLKLPRQQAKRLLSLA